MDSLYVLVLKPIMVSFIHDPAFIGFVIALIGGVLAYFKVPNWITKFIIELVMKALQAETAAEAKSETQMMSSEEKLKHASKLLSMSVYHPKEKKLLNFFGGAANFIEKTLPLARMLWKFIPKK